MKEGIKKVVPVILLAFFISGCGGGVSENKPISEIETETASMSANQLQGMVAKYESAIEKKRGEIEKLSEKLKEIPLMEMLGDEAKGIKAEVSEVNTSVKALTERLNVYAKALKVQMKATPTP